MSAITRRAVLAGVPAVAAVAAFPAVAAQEPHSKEWAEYQAWLRKIPERKASLERMDAILGRMEAELERLTGGVS